jgi:hypothetical protein
MNRIAAIALFAGAILMIASSAAAQSNVVEADVPFNFTVNNTLLPAGSYTFGFDLMHPGLLVIRDRTKNVKATDFGQRGAIGRGRLDVLIFHRYGSQYFLSEVHLNSAANGIFLPATKYEKKVEKVGGEENLASVAAH